MAYNENVTFLIFAINGIHYAIENTKVQEIIQNAKIYHLPFVPAYIEGVINCHGTPYTAVNPVLLFDLEGEKVIPNGTFLVFKRDDDQFAMHISSIDMFFEVEEEDVDVDNNTIRYKNMNVPVFDANLIEDRLLQDLGAND